MKLPTLFKRGDSKGSTVSPSVTPGIAYVDSWGGRRIGPGGGYTWGAGPKQFIGSSRGPETVTEIGRPGDFVEGEHNVWGPDPADQGFPYATRWPGYPGAKTGWEPPFYEAGNGSPFGPFMGGSELQGRVGTVFSCVDLVSRTLASLNLVRTQDSSPLLGLPWMDNPEPLIYTSMVDAMKCIVNSLLMRGNAYLQATARYADGTVARFVVLDPDCVEIEIDEVTKLPLYFIEGVFMPRSEICHVRYQMWPGAVYGVGPLEAAARNIASASALEQWGYQLAVNNGIPTAVLQSQAKLTRDQAHDIKMSWAQAATSRGTLPAVLSGGLTYEPLNLKPSDIGLLDLRTFDETRIASIFGVPLWLVGLPMNEGLTYATAQGTFDYFWRVTLRAMAYNISCALSSWALPRAQWIHIMADQLIRPDLPQRASAYKDLIESGIIQPEEARVFENIAPPGPETTRMLAQATEGGI